MIPLHPLAFTSTPGILRSFSRILIRSLDHVLAGIKGRQKGMWMGRNSALHVWSFALSHDRYPRFQIESIFWIFKWKAPFLVYFGLFWAIFGHFSDSTSINDSLTIELNYLLNWITTIIFELNNCLNWILGNQYWIEYWIESNFDEIQTLNWIVLGIDQGYVGVNPRPLL